VEAVLGGQVADNLPLYGVCCYMDELVARPPSALRPPGAAPPALPRFLVAAPRCYCLLTHYPFFALHLKARPYLTLYPGQQPARAASPGTKRRRCPGPALSTRAVSSA